MKFHRIIFIVAAVWYVITAFYSIGYFQSDEHYQIIEFARLIEGSNSAEDLSWEYSAQIRPALQPTICYLIFICCETLSITDPYNKTFVLRLITALLSVLAISFFTNSCRHLVSSKYWKPFLVFSYFLWFLPFINVRFSSEIWAGLALLTGLSLVIRDKKNAQNYLIAGALFGFSFLFRYQVAFAVVGLLLWLILIRKEQVSKLVLIALSGLGIVGLGIGIDTWFYGESVLTSWNYLETNIFDGKAPEFGTHPWYYYIYLILRYSFYPIGILILSAFFILIYKKPKNIFLWIILPFFLVHMLIPHKEFRFLFPIINLIPIVIILAIQEINWSSLSKRTQVLAHVAGIFLLLVNIGAVLIASIKPAGDGKMRITEKIREIAPIEATRIFYTNNDLFTPWAVTAHFYTQNNLISKKLDLPLSSASVVPNVETRNLLVVNVDDLNDLDILDLISRSGMKEVCKSVPNAFIPFLDIYGYSNKQILVLYSDQNDQIQVN